MSGRSLSSRERSLIRVTLAVLVLGFAIRFLWAPVQEWRTSRAQAAEALEEDLRKLDSDLERVRMLRKSVEAQKGRFGNPAVRFAEPREISQIIAYLEKLARENEMKLESYSPSGVDRSARLPHFDVRVKGKGDYPDVIRFLHSIDHADYVMRPVDLRLKGAKEMQVEMAIRIYLNTNPVGGESSR